jgi:hypothetical protein
MPSLHLRKLCRLCFTITYPTKHFLNKHAQRYGCVSAHTIRVRHIATTLNRPHACCRYYAATRWYARVSRHMHTFHIANLVLAPKQKIYFSSSGKNHRVHTACQIVCVLNHFKRRLVGMIWYVSMWHIK